MTVRTINTNNPMITVKSTLTDMVTNVNNDGDMNTSNSDNTVMNDGNMVTVNNNNINGRKKRSQENNNIKIQRNTQKPKTTYWTIFRKVTNPIMKTHMG